MNQWQGIEVHDKYKEKLTGCCLSENNRYINRRKKGEKDTGIRKKNKKKQIKNYLGQQEQRYQYQRLEMNYIMN